MNLVFGDTFYFLARLNSRDQHHHRALEFSASSRASIITSEWVLTEVADGFAESKFRRQVYRFLNSFRTSSNVEVVAASSDLFDLGLEMYNQHADKLWTLTDCISFVIMRQRNVTEALTGDKHFEQAGFIALLK